MLNCRELLEIWYARKPVGTWSETFDFVRIEGYSSKGCELILLVCLKKKTNDWYRDIDHGNYLNVFNWCPYLLSFKGKFGGKWISHVFGFVVLRDVVKVFPVSSPSFARRTTQKNRARSYSGARCGLVTKWDLKLVAWPLLPVLARSWPDVAIDRSRVLRVGQLLHLRKRRSFPIIYGSKWDPLTSAGRQAGASSEILTELPTVVFPLQERIWNWDFYDCSSCNFFFHICFCGVNFPFQQRVVWKTCVCVPVFSDRFHHLTVTVMNQWKSPCKVPLTCLWRPGMCYCVLVAAKLIMLVTGCANYNCTKVLVLWCND